MRKEAPGIFGTTEVKWNFTKFLVDRNGEVVNRFGSDVKPEDLAEDIEELL
jgi:glutathione peroxidase